MDAAQCDRMLMQSGCKVDARVELFKTALKGLNLGKPEFARPKFVD